MPNWKPIPLGQNCYEGRSGVVSLERLVNLYPEMNPQNAKGPVALHGTPGLLSWSSIGEGPIRGSVMMGDDLFVVSDTSVYAINESKTATFLGTVVRGDRALMTTDGVYVVIVVGARTYAASRTAGVVITASGVMNGLTYQDGYAIATEQGSQNVWITNQDDMITISALDYTTVDVFPDNVMGCISDHREVVVFKEKSTEILYNSGASGFPFVRQQGGFLERGCGASYSIAKIGNVVYWLGDDLRVYGMVGRNPVPISTHHIERLVREASGPDLAYGFTYSQDGHDFYVLTFEDRTVCYDTTTKRWHERESYPAAGSTGVFFESLRDTDYRWQPNCYTYGWGKHLVGDFESGDIYELDLDTYTDNGTVIRRSATSPPLHGAGNSVSLFGVYADMEAGVGVTTGQGDDPEVMLNWSDDGGKTWTDHINAKVGKIGEYKNRAMWYRLGQFKQRSLRLEISDPVKVGMVGLYADMEIRK